MSGGYLDRVEKKKQKKVVFFCLEIPLADIRDICILYCSLNFAVE